MYDKLDAVTAETYRRMQAAGRMLINHNPLPSHGLPRFFRLAFVQSSVRRRWRASVRGDGLGAVPCPVAACAKQRPASYVGVAG